MRPRPADFKARRALAGLVFVLALYAAGGPAFAQSAAPFPRLPVTTLSGRALNLPNGIAGHNAILVVGFTQTSERQTVVWRKHLSSRYAESADTIVYPVIVIQNIPRIFHGLLLAGIRAGVPKSEWEHFLVVSADESRWKPAIGWKGPDLAYVVLVDGAGKIAWRGVGPYTEAGAAALEAEVSRLKPGGRRPAALQ